MSRPPFVLVGGGLTAGAAVSKLRGEGFDGRIVLIGDERHPPYERPPLSKAYLRGEETEPAFLLAPTWYEDNDVELLLGHRVTDLDPPSRSVSTDDGQRFGYDALLIATGGRNRQLAIPGADLEGVLSLRTIEDAAAIRAAATHASRVVIVGAGFIGCEVAASLRHLGLEVEVVEPLPAPMVRAVGPEVAAVFEAIHRDRGVRFHFGEGAERFEGTTAVEAVTTSSGRRIDADLVVVGVGIVPNVELATAAGIDVQNGILVDGRCRTSVPNVYAAGDVANHLHPRFGRIRVEHFDNALKQGAAAARSMLGRDEPYDDPHWFWSDQYDHNLQYIGHAPAYDAFVVRGSLEDRSFVGFYLNGGIVDAVVGLDRGRDVRRAAALVGAKRPVDERALRDEDVDLRKLASGGDA